MELSTRTEPNWLLFCRVIFFDCRSQSRLAWEERPACAILEVRSAAGDMPLHDSGAALEAESVLETPSSTGGREEIAFAKDMESHGRCDSARKSNLSKLNKYE